MENSRRSFFKKGALLAAGTIVTNIVSAEQLNEIEKITEQLSEEKGIYPIVLPPLPYAYDALEPFIDKQTMEIHHDKHHKAYVDNVNKVLDEKSKLSLEDYFKNISKHDKSIRNNGGGHYNHSLFWTLLKENKEGKENLPTGKVLEEINNHFKSFDEFKKLFAEQATKRFGSGWVWLVKDNKGKLLIGSTPNQDNPLMDVSDIKGKPVLCLDVWEHAYYLKYQNKRADYVNAWWNVINWDRVNELLS